MLAVGETFRAGGKLRLLTAPGYTPQPGDRFRLVEFAAEINDVQKIFEFYRFKNYDPTIPGSSYFWGLIFRGDAAPGGKQFIEAVVLRKPRLSSDGPPLPPVPSQPGLIFITHGTKDKIDTAADSPRGLGELAEAIQTFTALHGNGEWQTATFDWNELATTVGGSDFFYNPASSAQNGIGLAESLVHWMQTNGFQHQKLHLLSHSSGSWFVNRMAQLLAGTADTHLTLFDAYTPPGQASGCFLGLFWCNRFRAELGERVGNAFVEHYVDRSIWNAPGTDTHLTEAVNIDVTRATNPTPPQSVSCCLPTAHAWPYKWYLHSVRAASAGTINSDHLECSGFGLSPEFRESSLFSPGLVTPYERAKKNFSSMRGLSELLVSGQSCHFVLQPIYRHYLDIFLNALTAPFGVYTLISPDEFQMRTASESPFQFLADPPPGQFAGVTCTVTNNQVAVGLKFDFQFTEGTNAILTVLVDGQAQRQILQDTIGNVSLNSGEIRVFPPLNPGTHQIEFRLETKSGTPVAINISNVELGYDTGPAIAAPPARVGPSLEWSFVGVTGRTNYVVEGSSNLLHWTTVTNLSGADGLFTFQTPVAEAHRFFRVVAP